MGVRRGVAVVAVLMGALGAACGPGLAGAKDAVSRAEEEGKKLGATNAPDEITLSYRIRLKSAQNSLEKHHYKRAATQASEARSEAIRVIEKRDKLAGEVRARVDTIRKVIESQPRPTAEVLSGYFDALEAFERQEYEAAAEIIARVETSLLRETRMTMETGIAIQGDDNFYRDNEVIPLFADISETGEPGKVIRALKRPVRAVFLGNRFFSRKGSYTHVFIDEEGYRVEGWVERRFIQ